ncbi:hypothetical protein AB5J62_05150 [Amycolatopsis sp. cg5]|uniref:hypothetical protein n=1 Tax=Amycolatopsis sp. cg5 TaxID=3238802 RepID=UPI0035241465
MTAMPITTRDYELLRAPESVVPSELNEIKVEETSEMLLHEELAKARIQELEESFREARVRGSIRSARAARRWSKLAQWASDRAHRHQH